MVWHGEPAHCRLTGYEFSATPGQRRVCPLQRGLGDRHQRLGVAPVEENTSRRVGDSNAVVPRAQPDSGRVMHCAMVLAVRSDTFGEKRCETVGEPEK